MISSLWRIEFLTGGASTLLADYGDMLADEIRPTVKQAATEFGALGGRWGGTQADGRALTTIAWTVWIPSAGGTVATLRDDMLLAAATFPAMATGTLRITVQGGAVWEMAKASLATFETAPDAAWPAGTAASRVYSATGGQLLPTTPIPLRPGLPVEFILQPVDDLILPIENY